MKHFVSPGLGILLLFSTALDARIDTDTNTADSTGSSAETFQLQTIAPVRSAPDGRIIDIWDPATRFTSSQRQGDWLRITGHFPGSQWQPLQESVWIHHHYAKRFQPDPGSFPSNRPRGITRFIEIDKHNFELRVIEEKQNHRQVVLKTVVALGMDACMPREKGGQCYYTEPGEYAVRWKVYDPQGIEWCIPAFMEKEYADAIARGERCYRGAIGTHALNIGKSYAIHGTSNPASLGSRASRGCVRADNRQMEKIFALMDVGDKVYILE